MNAETIKDFLVSLGFQVDEAGSRKFDSVVAGTTAQVMKMGVAVEAAALSVVAYTAKIASGLDNLYWASQRTGATVAGIQQIGYAVSQMGGTVDGARSSLENLARFVRNSPGAEGFLNRLGVQTRDAKGNMRDMASVFTGVGQRLSSMPYYRANQYAQMLGIDENTLLAMRRGVGQFSAQYSQMAKAIGFNADQAAASSNKFITSLRSFGQMAGMARDKIGSNLAEGLSGSIDTLRKQIVDNFPKIEGVITSGAKGIIWLAEVIGRVVTRLIDAAEGIQRWWGTLDKSTREMIELIGGLAAAFWVLNRAMYASPITWVLGLAAAVALLWEDYKTWKEGGKSLIDWGKWKPEIDAAIKGVDEFIALVKEMALQAARLFGIDPKAWSLKWEFDDVIKNLGDLAKMLKLIGDLMNAAKEGRWSDVVIIGKELLAQGNGNPDALPGVTQNAQETREKVIGFWGQIKERWKAGGWYNAQNAPKPTKNGAALLGWLGPTLNNLEQLYKLPTGLLRSVAIAESSGDPNAMSGAGAQGLFQLMPGTAKDLGLRGNDSFDPVKSAGAAAKYLSQLMKSNGGDLEKALASYNWGIGNVQKHGMGLMPEETRNYIPRVLSNMPSSAGGAQISQETNIHIHGVSDPGQAGKAVADQQTSVNSRFSQSMSTGPR
ncbi:transglycosylase SLT domain-containing protein [uncultured Pantoea sp.]|uniref:lytic transglycosylase domain-containing protein n=1 Tax=uncultured Pantoea sp. TaxID=218084 RepID=UPI0025CDCACC|nr:transglycosylase SLT domain-containing protein [uncultured Pantoea sp.]